jgi:hypothetical protein
LPHQGRLRILLAAWAQLSKSADAGPLSRCTLYSPTGPAAPFGSPKAPRIDPPVPLGARGAFDCIREQRGPAHMGPTASAKSTPACQKHATNFLTAKIRKGTRCAAYCHARWRAYSAAISSPSPRFARLGVLTSLYSAFSNPVLERLGYGMASMRLISRDAGR